MQKKLPEATHEGVLTIGQHKIPCAVLADGTRLLTQGGFLQAIGRSRTPKAGTGGGVAEIPTFLAAANLKPFVNNELLLSSTPIAFITTKGARAVGYKADILASVCYVYIDAEKAGVLTSRQEKYADRSHILIRGFATVGIIALVDEATGYQETRQRDALQKILDKYLRKEYAAWARCFPIEFYEELFRLRGWSLDKKTMKMPGVVGKYTNDLIYDRLAPGILEELQNRNPVVEETGRRKAKHHQWLTQETGHPSLDKHFNGVLALMRANNNWDQFKRGVERAYPRIGSQLALKLFDDDSDDPEDS
jgi:hypothetical protein